MIVFKYVCVKFEHSIGYGNALVGRFRGDTLKQTIRIPPPKFFQNRRVHPASKTKIPGSITGGTAVPKNLCQTILFYKKKTYGH